MAAVLDSDVRLRRTANNSVLIEQYTKYCCINVRLIHPKNIGALIWMDVRIVVLYKCCDIEKMCHLSEY